jgi:hypothetical protein
VQIMEVVDVKVGERVLRTEGGRSKFEGEDEVFVGPVYFKLAEALKSS